MILAVVLVCVLAVSVDAYAVDRLERRLLNCAAILSDMMSIGSEVMTYDLFSQCSAIAIFPDTVKDHFLWGKRYGPGIMLVRDIQKNIWSPPVFLSVDGIEMGRGLGFGTKNIVLFIFGSDVVESLLKDGANLDNNAMLPFPGTLPAGSENYTFKDKQGVLCYSVNYGKIKRVDISGTDFTANYFADRSFYNMDTDPKEILFGKRVKEPRSARQVSDILDRLSKQGENTGRR